MKLLKSTQLYNKICPQNGLHKHPTNFRSSNEKLIMRKIVLNSQTAKDKDAKSFKQTHFLMNQYKILHILK